MNDISEPAPLRYSLGKGVPGSYDGIFLKPKGNTWRHPPSNRPLKSKFLYVPQGTPLPLKHEERLAEIPTNMFLFGRNQVAPECCPATYSTYGGCICTTPEQRRFIAQERGNNKTYPNYSF